MKKLLLIAATLFASFTTKADPVFCEETDIDDLALIYIGSQHRPHWGKEQFKPYVMHTFADGTQSWMFDGFLMIEFTAWNSKGAQVSFGEFNATGAQKEDWEWLLDRQLGISTGEGCKALDELIGELIPVLGKPGHKHKVVLTMPTAVTSLGIGWGSIDGRQLDLSLAADRQRAHEWYTNLIISKWESCHFKNLELEGVYWVQEASNDTHIATMRSANNYVHKMGLKVFWIPYSTAAGRYKWRDAGIDVAYLQPNYFFKEDTPYSQLEAMVADSWENFSGVEMEFEGYDYSWWTGLTEAIRVDKKNNALYAVHPNFYARLVDYVNEFEKQQVFDGLPIAYYSGFQAVYDFAQSGHPKDAEIMHRLAKHINERHVLTGFDKEPSSAGVDDIKVGDQSIAYPVEGGIYIAYGQAANVDIYTVDGRCIYIGSMYANHDESGVVPCSKGIYIVRAGDKSLKLAVR